MGIPRQVLKVLDAFVPTPLKAVFLFQKIRAKRCCPFGEELLRFAHQHVWPKYGGRSGVGQTPEAGYVRRAAGDDQPRIAPIRHLATPWHAD